VNCEFEIKRSWGVRLAGKERKHLMDLFALATFAEIAFSEIHAAGSPESKLAAER
jgi:hypothetical protein